MGARSVKGFIRFGGGDASMLIKIEGEFPKGNKCTQDTLKAEILAALAKCGITVRQFDVTKMKSQP
jgi:hypothetical protein